MNASAEAIRLADLGVPVFPTLGKRPPEGFLWKSEATTDKTTILDWWAKWPDANVAMPLPQGTVAIDVDDPVAFARTRFAAELPATATQATRSGGSHHFYRTAKPVKQVVKGFDESFDTRAGGMGYVVVWEADKITDPLTWIDAPAWVYEEPSTSASGDGQHNQLVSMAGTLLNKGVDRDQMHKMLWAMAQSFVASDPTHPWRERHVETIVRDAFDKWDAKVAPATRTPVIYQLDAFLDLPRLSEPWRIEGLLQAVGTGYIIAARKHGKTLMSAQMALCVASGRDFLGYPVEQAPVLLIEEEGGQSFYIEHIERQARAMKAGKGLPIFIAHRGGFRLDEAKSLDFLREQIQKYDAKLVIAGTMSRLASIKEANQGREWNEIGTTLNNIATEFGCMTTIAHHARKDSKPSSIEEMIDSALGSTQIAGNVDSILGLWRPISQEDGLLFSMSRDAEGERIGVRFDRSTLLLERDDSNLAGKNAQRVSTLLAVLADGANHSLKDLLAATGIPRTTLQRLLKDSPDVEASKLNGAEQFKLKTATVTTLAGQF